MREVRGKIRTGHQNVIKVETKEDPRECDPEPLKSLGSVAEAKWHFGELKKAKGDDNDNLHQVEFRENCGAIETV